jgi:aspartate/glutamate racemase
MKELITPCFGILGGLGAHATALLHRKIIERTLATKDSDYPHLLIYNLGLQHFGVDANLTSGDGAQLKTGVQTLKRSGCDKVWVACNSVHISKSLWFDESVCVDWTVGFASSLPIDVVVLGSRATVKHSLYNSTFSRNFLQTQQLVDDCIESVICGEITQNHHQARQRWLSLLDSLDAKPIALGCTDLSVCLDAFGANGRVCFDSLDFIADDILNAHRTHTRDPK